VGSGGRDATLRMSLRLPLRIMRRGMLAYGRLSRGMTLGVRAMLLKEGGVLLVRHTYVPDWYLPGGGVEVGESAEEALAREVAEEAGARLSGTPQLFGLYHNLQADRRDHVALFVCREWAMDAARKPDLEIAAVELFPLGALPEDTTPATRARLSEVLGDAPVSSRW
jgi:ADP-ribose pyrophosphatase YjhB (NUDIX family)